MTTKKKSPRAAGSKNTGEVCMTNINLSEVPKRLRDQNGWLLWYWGNPKPDGTRAKIPRYVDGKLRGAHGTEDDLKRLATFDAAVARLKDDPRVAGVGFATLPQFGIVALDLDRKPGKEAEHLTDEQIAALHPGTYAERSPSGKGVRAFYVGKMPTLRGGRNGVEVFSAGQFVTITGDKLAGSPRAIPVLSKALRAKLETYRVAPITDGDDALEAVQDRMHLTTPETRKMLRYIPPASFLQYDPWFALAKGLHFEGEGDADWLQLFHEASERTGAYDAEECDEKWDSLGHRGGWQSTLGPIAALAQQGGWQPPRRTAAAVAQFAPLPLPERRTASASRELVITAGDKVEMRNIQWLWPGRLPRKFLSVYAADSGSGKSTATAAIVATITTGAPWPGETTRREPAWVIWMGVEDPLSEVTVPRLRAAGADMRRVQFITSTRLAGAESLFSLQDDLNLMQAHLARMRSEGKDVALIVVDPVTAYLHGKRKINPHVATELRSVLTPFAQVCDAENIATICITHLTKDKARGFIDSVLGSQALVALSRAVWGFAHVPGEADDSYVMFWGKGNLGAPGVSLRFTLVSAEVQTDEGEIIITSRVVWGAEDITLTKETVWGSPRGPAPTYRHEVGAWLREYLSDGQWHVAETVRAAMAAEGYSPSIIRTANEEICDKQNRGGIWKWRLKTQE